MLLQQLFGHLGTLPAGAAWLPADVANDFADIATNVFRLSELTEQALHSHLMLLGAHPTEDVGIPGYARCSVHVLRSPGAPGLAVSETRASVTDDQKVNVLGHHHVSDHHPLPPPHLFPGL